MINIIGGKFKGTKLQVPENIVRPTSSIKREAIFSILESYALQNSYDLYEKKCFIDLFAGSGSLGLEAVSRGASHAYFFESNQNAHDILSVNCQKICKNNQFNIFLKNCNYFNQINFIYPISVIFIDPPYKLNPFNELFIIFIKKNILSKNTILVLEFDKKTIIKMHDKMIKIKEKIYGKTKILFLKKN